MNFLNLIIISASVFFASAATAKVNVPSFSKKATPEEVAWCKQQAKLIYNQNKKKSWKHLNTFAFLDESDPSLIKAGVAYDPSPCDTNLPSNVIACVSVGQSIDVYCKNGEVVDIVY